MENLINTIKKSKLGREFRKGNFGIEKESLRVDGDGNLSIKQHPSIFGDKKLNPYITVDFSESQLEMITPTFESIDESYNFLKNIHEIVSLNLDNEYIWSQSVPPILPSDNEIPIAKFPNNKELETYREKLAKKYGKKKQLLSGVHFNFSFDNELLEELYELSEKNISFKEFKNELYLKICRGYFRYGWLIIYLLGASPVVHKTYSECCIKKMIPFAEDVFYFEDSFSFRNGICGYKNLEKIEVDYKNLSSYISSIEKLISDGVLEGAREYYSPIRVKAKNSKDILKGLKDDGIEYLEIRSIDLNPFSDIGLDIRDLKFIHLFLMYLALIDDEEFTFKDYERYLKNQELLATIGRKKDFTLICCKDKNVSPKEYANHILNEIQKVLEDNGILIEEDINILNYQKNKINSNELYTEKLLKDISKEGFIKFHIDQAKYYLEEAKRNEYTLKGYEDLELSTQILLKEAIKIGVKFEILDRNENFISLEKEGNLQYVKQATKTSLDSFVTMLIMENKVVTKKVLEKAKIKVPTGKDYVDIEKAKNDYKKYRKGVVIKPKSTNFGLGITIFKDEFSKEDYEKAIDIAFKEDSSILIEEFIQGKEYRIFVIGDEVVGILHRVPANVIGDGQLNIKELIEKKNEDPLRGVGYKTPLEKIKSGEAEEMFLKTQGLNFDYIPEKDEIVYLRENSNISTGGDSLDFTDEIFQEYKDLAVKAAKAAGAKICGVDMMIEDIKNNNPEGNYAIIEINFNPAIHIHCYPYKGENRKLGEKLLVALGY